MTSNDRHRPLGEFTMFPLEPLPADLLSGSGGLERNLNRMAERVRDEAIADFMACPEVQGILRGEVVEIDPATVSAVPTVYDPEEGWVAVDVTEEVLPPNRVPQVHCRGRWRAVKRKLRALAAELGWPGCMEVASVYQVEGRVLMAGAKLAAWHKLTSKHRRKPADRTVQRRHRKTLRANLRDPDYVPF